MRGQCLCPVCGKLVYINDDYTLRVHGRRNRRCPGKREPKVTPEPCAVPSNASKGDE